MLRAFGTDTAAAAAGTEKATPHGLASLPDTVMITQGPVLAAGVTQEQVMLCADTAPAGFDAVLCPTAPILPPNIDKLMEQGEYYVTANLLALRNTRVGNVMGGCALTLPTGTPSCGLSLMAPPMQEDRLLRLGIAAERALA